MSRIGRLPIQIPSGVTVTVNDSQVQVKGPKGQLTQDIVPSVSVSVEDGAVHVARADDAKQSKSSHGLMRALINNMVTGVTTGFEKKLQIQGIGYRADVQGSKLVMQLGYSHPIEFAIPKGVAIEADKSNNIFVRGIDRQQVGQVAADIRSYRTPDRYKGKGVRYADEVVRLKAGKTA